MHCFVVSVRTSIALQSVSQLDLEQGLIDLGSECYKPVKKILFGVHRRFTVLVSL